jgi:hypothetical protein
MEVEGRKGRDCQLYVSMGRYERNGAGMYFYPTWRQVCTHDRKGQVCTSVQLTGWYGSALNIERLNVDRLNVDGVNVKNPTNKNKER